MDMCSVAVVDLGGKDSLRGRKTREQPATASHSSFQRSTEKLQWNGRRNRGVGRPRTIIADASKDSRHPNMQDPKMGGDKTPRGCFVIGLRKILYAAALHSRSSRHGDEKRRGVGICFRKQCRSAPDCPSALAVVLVCVRCPGGSLPSSGGRSIGTRRRR